MNSEGKPVKKNPNQGKVKPPHKPISKDKPMKKNAEDKDIVDEGEGKFKGTKILIVDQEEGELNATEMNDASEREVPFPTFLYPRGEDGEPMIPVPEPSENATEEEKQAFIDAVNKQVEQIFQYATNIFLQGGRNDEERKKIEAFLAAGSNDDDDVEWMDSASEGESEDDKKPAAK